MKMNKMALLAGLATVTMIADFGAQKLKQQNVWWLCIMMAIKGRC
jgi:hypothetical protein